MICLDVLINHTINKIKNSDIRDAVIESKLHGFHSGVSLRSDILLFVLVIIILRQILAGICRVQITINSEFV